VRYPPIEGAWTKQRGAEPTDMSLIPADIALTGRLFNP
jgi:hypothetical protein